MYKDTALTTNAWENPKGLIEAQLGFGVGLGFINDRPQFVDGTVLLDILVQPRLGYFVSDKFQLGIELINYRSISGLNGVDSYTLSYNLVGPYLRYQLNPSIFFELAQGWGSGKEETTDDAITSTNARFASKGFQPRVGITSNWSNHLRFSLLVSYNVTTNRYEDSDVVFKVTGLGIQPSVGITF